MLCSVRMASMSQQILLHSSQYVEEDLQWELVWGYVFGLGVGHEV